MNAISALVLLAAMSIAPDECVKDYLVAVNGNAMGWFCARWNCGNREFEAASQMDLYRKVAGDVLAGRVYDLRPWEDPPTILVKTDDRTFQACIAKVCPKIPFDGCFRFVGTRNGWREYEWKISPTSQNLVKDIVAELREVKPGPPRKP